MHLRRKWTLALGVALVIAGCGGGSDGGSATTTSAATSTTIETTATTDAADATTDEATTEAPTPDDDGVDPCEFATVDDVEEVTGVPVGEAVLEDLAPGALPPVCTYTTDDGTASIGFLALEITAEPDEAAAQAAFDQTLQQQQDQAAANPGIGEVSMLDIGDQSFAIVALEEVQAVYVRTGRFRVRVVAISYPPGAVPDVASQLAAFVVERM